MPRAAISPPPRRTTPPSKGYSDADIEEIRSWKKKIEAFHCHAIYMADNRTMALFWFKDGRAWMIGR
jgi:hypothetical protein